MILIVGQNPPSKKAATNPKGTATERKLSYWLNTLEIDDYRFINCSKDRGKTFKIDYDNLIKETRAQTVVALGSVASKALTKINVEHFKMPHPSPMNRQLNDKEYERQKLMELYLWLKCNKI
tara:strand:+ start:173 stop:538 length:366 start_codon:yes stop_codon:yes gene_type:complete